MNRMPAARAAGQEVEVDMHAPVRPALPAVALILLLTVAHAACCVAAPSAKDAWRPFSPRTGPPSGLAGVAGARDVLWSQPPDLNGYKVSSEQIPEFGMESWIADDFVLPFDATITRFTFWGGYYNWEGEDPNMPFNVLLFHDWDCWPSSNSPYWSRLVVPLRTYMGFDGYGYPTYRYDAFVSIPVTANTTTWLAAQAASHPFPPQWGRQQAMEERDCAGMYWSSCMTWDCWGEVSWLVGEPWDASFELEVLPDEPEACCLPRGACQVIPPQECMQAGGTRQGPDAICDPNPCPMGFVCCFPDGGCRYASVDACFAQGGILHAQDLVCEPNPCPAPAACCLESGSCIFLPPDRCVEAGGVPYEMEEASCDPNPCANAVQACCWRFGICLMRQDSDCLALGGLPMGRGTICEPNPCGIGACCYADGHCYSGPVLDCERSGGDHQGVGTECSQSPCAYGACCFLGGSCSVLEDTACIRAGGRPQEPGTACDPDPCAEPFGACCLLDGTCLRVTASACDELGGAYQGDETACDSDPCGGPTAVESITWGRLKLLFR